MAQATLNRFRWLVTGRDAFASTLAAIEQARNSIELEVYTFATGTMGNAFREALTRAAGRGVHVRVLIDAFGSLRLHDAFWQPLRAAGAEVRWFNPVRLGRYSIRDHRKLLACDDDTGFVGGFNVSDDYMGDGVSRGWRDLGLEIRGPAATLLRQAFASSWSNAELRQPRVPRLRKSRARAALREHPCDLLLSGPGRNTHFIQQQLLNDLRRASDVDLMVAYYLPTLRLRRALKHVAQRNGRVRMVFAGKTDVPMARAAARSFYRRLLRAGVEIWEYEPQILHAKIIVIDDIVYVGSSNLDTRSLQINFELMLRVRDAGLADEGRRIVDGDVRRSRRITLEGWREQQTFWSRLWQRWARFFFVRIDLGLARRHMKLLR